MFYVCKLKLKDQFPELMESVACRSNTEAERWMVTFGRENKEGDKVAIVKVWLE